MKSRPNRKSQDSIFPSLTSPCLECKVEPAFYDGNGCMGGLKITWTSKMYPLSFGEVAVILKEITKTKKAVSGRRETAVFLSQLLVVQLTRERVGVDWWSIV